jgi:hypothetical protein
MNAAGTGLFGDHRNNEDRCPYLFEFINATTVNRYNIKNDGWTSIQSPALTGTFGAGANGVFMPHRGPRGTVSAATTTSLTMATLESIGGTALSVSTNQWADGGQGTTVLTGTAYPGYKIRIYDTTVGKTQECFITANSSGTTPVVYFSPALTWSPTAATTHYEILSGRLYLISAGTTAAGVWKCYDISTDTWSGNLSTTNLPGTLGANDSSLVCLDECYVPSNMLPSQGIFGNITATGSSSSTLTGSTNTSLDGGILANEFRNFQIRIIQDTVTPGSVGQRNRIASHTAGPSPVYTMSTSWTTQPSSSAVFVIEYPNDIIYSGSSQTTTYTYFSDAAPGLNSGAATADSWSSTMYGARGTACGAGTEMVCPFGVSNAISTGYTTLDLYGSPNDPGKNFRYSYLFSFRGGTTNTVDYLDIAGAAAGAWTNATTVDIPFTSLFTTQTSVAYDGISNNGVHCYINYNGGQQWYRFNIYTRKLHEWAYRRYPSTVNTSVGHRSHVSLYCDPSGTPRLTFLYNRLLSGSTTGASTELFENLISR